MARPDAYISDDAELLLGPFEFSFADPDDFFRGVRDHLDGEIRSQAFLENGIADNRCLLVRLDAYDVPVDGGGISLQRLVDPSVWLGYPEIERGIVTAVELIPVGEHGP